jgi:ribosomal protein S16
MDRVKHWLSVGATPSDTVSELLKLAETASASAAKA